MRYSWIAAIAFLILLAPSLETRAAEVPDFIAAAVADPNRPDADRQRDADRKPAQTLMFAGVRPSEQIAELMPGGGYFTRIFSKAIGDSGHIYALVPAPLATAAADAPDFAARIKAVAKDPHYANVSVVVEPFSQLNVPAPVDMVWTSDNYHDLHNFPGLDLTVFNQMVFAALKPGGIYFIIDHVAPAGSGISDTNTLHRIDPSRVRADVEAAGFKFVGSSDVLRNPADPHTAIVFDPAIRGHADQFVFKFRKPG